MKPLLTSLLILFFAISCSGQPLPNKREQTNFLKWYLAKYPHQNLFYKYIRFETNFDIGELKEINTIAYRTSTDTVALSDADLFYIREQTKINQQGQTLDPGIYQHPLKKNKRTPISFISLPVFSVNRQLAFINTDFQCGPICGRGEISVFKLIDGEWVKQERRFWGTWMR